MLSMISDGAKMGEILVSEVPFTLTRIEKIRARILLK